MLQLLYRKFQAGIFFILLLLMSCNEATGKPERATGAIPAIVPDVAKNRAPEPIIDEPQSRLSKQKEYKTCEALITELVQSSNAVALSSFKAVQVRIDEMSREKITIELYTINSVSEDPAIERKAERTVAWLEFFPDTGKLQDITNDPENPELLRYNTGILQKSEVVRLCFNAPPNQ